MEPRRREEETNANATVLDEVLEALEIEHDDFYFSRAAVIIPTVTGSISAFSSLLVMSIILRSQSQLSSSYHRIMFFLSFWDIITSIATALTTIPMPVDVLYPFSGRSYGNATTCAAQGFIIILGKMLTICSNCALNLYYVSTFWYGMTERTIRTRLLPSMFVFFALVCIPAATVPLVMGLYNPRPYEPYCLIGSYPPKCNHHRDNTDDDEFVNFECIGREVPLDTERKIITTYLAFVGAAFVLVCISLLLVVISVFQTERNVRTILQRLKEMVRDIEREREQIEIGAGMDYDGDNSVHNHTAGAADGTGAHSSSNTSSHFDDSRRFHQTRTILRVALMYIMAFLLTWMWEIIAIVLGSVHMPDLFWEIVDHGKLLCSPSQGLFNALIFIYNKMHITRESNPSMTWFQALKVVLFHPFDIPEVLLSSIDMVVREENERMTMEQQRQQQQQQREEEEEEQLNEGGEGVVQQQQQQNLKTRNDDNEEHKILSSSSSIISPVLSIPSNISSLHTPTPSFALSNALSSKGIDKVMDEDQFDLPNSNQRLYYSATPPKFLKWSQSQSPSRPPNATSLSPSRQPNTTPPPSSAGAVLAGSATPSLSEASASASASTSKGMMDSNEQQWRGGARGGSGSGSGSAGRSGGSGESVFTLNSMLSGFSSILAPVKEHHDHDHDRVHQHVHDRDRHADGNVVAHDEERKGQEGEGEGAGAGAAAAGEIEDDFMDHDLSLADSSSMERGGHSS